ncbi:MAG: hypothetical protein GY849_08805 [Deltaproteobacteria bacterium]|nr:hypothetical protein [Deltaproteobacteria bacterium]
MNSPVEEIFAFKGCCGIRAFDQNLEIHVENRGDHPVDVPSYFDLKSRSDSCRIDTLMPQGVQRIKPGETKAFYCQMDETQWKKARQIIFYDTRENAYLAEIRH